MDTETMKNAAVRLDTMATEVVDQINLEYGRMKPLSELIDEIDFNEYVEPVYAEYGMEVAQLVMSLVLAQRGQDFTSSVEMANECIRQYRLRSKFTSRTGRFYLYFEPAIYEMEAVIEDTDAADYFRNQLVRLYKSWLDEMTQEERANLFTYNTRAGGANTNGLLAELEFEKYTEDLDFDVVTGTYTVKG